MVTVSVGGRFHAFNLAYQLYRKNCLQALMTSYPKYGVSPYGIPNNFIRSFPAKEMLQRVWQKMPRIITRQVNSQLLLCDLYDRNVEGAIADTDIVVAWASFALHTMRAAKKRGAITILECGSAHIEYQVSLLADEYERWGIERKIGECTHGGVIAKMLQEYEAADYISIPSHFVRQTFIDKGIDENKLIHVPYGVDLRQFHRAEKKDSVFRIVFAGGICIRKGVHYLLQAVSELKLQNCELLLVGAVDSEMIPFLKKYEGSYRLVGRVPQAELCQYYSSASVFTLPSVEDGFGMVIAQAMACGLPVIASTNTGAADIVRDGIDGYIIPIRDVEAYKEKLQYLYDNQDVCRQMGENARQRVSEGFTWDDYGTKILRAYEDAMNRRK